MPTDFQKSMTNRICPFGVELTLFKRDIYVIKSSLLSLLSDLDYPNSDVEEMSMEEEPNNKYVFQLLDPKDDERRRVDYEYAIVKKKNSRLENSSAKKESAFRERSHHSDNDRLRDLFMDPDETEHKKDDLEERSENDAEYALLLSQLWTKYKHNKHHNDPESNPQGVVKLYKDKIVKKRYPDNWGPIAFKRKRSSGPEIDHPVSPDYGKKSADSNNYNGYLPDDDDDLREEYAIAFQPLDDDSFQDLNDDEQYAYETVEKRFPVTKRSSGSFEYVRNIQKKRSTQEQKKRDISRNYRSSSGTDPKLLKDLSIIFGEPEQEVFKKPVKRSSNNEENSHEAHKPPQVSVLSHNESHHANHSKELEEGSHEQHSHIHHPGMFGKESDHPPEHAHETEKPIIVKKKSIDWSDYFGIDKRKKKSNTFVNDLNQDRLRKQYFDTFNKEVIYPVTSHRGNNKVKRNYMQEKPSEETGIQTENSHAEAVKSDEQSQTPREDANTKLENIDKKLKNMEGLIVDEALNYSNVGEELDSKEEQDMKEKLLSKLAAAYSLEKMRKALKEFKQSLQIHKSEPSGMQSSPIPTEEAKSKRVAVKKEKVIPELDNEIPIFRKEDKGDDFEEEQGAGQYLNGRVEEQFSEGYMGGSGRHKIALAPTGMCDK